MSIESRDPHAIDGDARDGDARDAVTGPIGDARLVEPETLGDRDNKLEQLTPIDDSELAVPEGQV